LAAPATVMAMGPPLISDDCTCTPTLIGSVADLTTQGFSPTIDFMGGTLQLTNNVTTNEALMMLSNGVSGNGSTIDTHGFDLTLTGDIRDNGRLLKRNAGTLTIAGHATNSGGFLVTGGTLAVTGTAGDITVDKDATGSGTLTGTGQVHSVNVIAGTIIAGVNGHVGRLDAYDLTLHRDTTMRLKINGQLDADRDLIVAGTTRLNGAHLQLDFNYQPTSGQTFFIAANVQGFFDGVNQGGIVKAGNAVLRADYFYAGTSNLVLTADAAPFVDDLTNRIGYANTPMVPFDFFASDDFTPLDQLIVTAKSSDQSIVPDGNISVTQSARDPFQRRVQARPTVSGYGTVTITITVSDGVQSTSRTMTYTVMPPPSYYLAEGSTGNFFSTDILLANPNKEPSAYGAAMEKASLETSKQWYFAEGSQGFFQTYFLLLNPSAIIESTQPVIVEHSLYANANGVVWAAGTNATGTPLP
jgi:hypothetical protein